ncbi:SMI1/KNR4 family protein [Nocardiopsis halophila]|uniref:SMI1/KNR4 family protein n=1 Tax=Nocardiopsis halophila TaxID=141692 RepID=UPI000373974F|nr:SMI1/KNR4 family protein [Nocardiopsis halophila]
MRRCSGHPAWLPFGDGEDGNHLAVDLSPAPDGRPGQVVRFGRDYTDGPVLVADSVTSLIRRYLAALRQGEYEKTDRGLHVGREDPDRPPLSGHLEDPADAPTTLQAIRINGASGPVDLSPLAKTPHLRLLHLDRCTSADLSPVGALPVESLRVDLDGGSLTPLEGHRCPASLKASTSAPIGITPLRTAENLRGLDLSRAVVRDLTVLGELKGLRYLSLNAEQWSTVFANGAVPPALAAARSATEDAAFEDALAWASHLGLDTGDALRASGFLGQESNRPGAPWR